MDVLNTSVASATATPRARYGRMSLLAILLVIWGALPAGGSFPAAPGWLSLVLVVLLIVVLLKALGLF